MEFLLAHPQNPQASPLHKISQRLTYPEGPDGQTAVEMRSQTLLICNSRGHS